jgi:hypothetical protein
MRYGVVKFIKILYLQCLAAGACITVACSDANSGTPATASTKCVTVTINDLWRNPKQFENQRICASGFLGRMVTYGEDSPKLYATEAEAQATKLERFATLGVTFTIATQEHLSRYSGQAVRAEGILKLEFPCTAERHAERLDSVCSPPPSLRIAKAHLTFADGTKFPE